MYRSDNIFSVVLVGFSSHCSSFPKAHSCLQRRERYLFSQRLPRSSLGSAKDRHHPHSGQCIDRSERFTGLSSERIALFFLSGGSTEQSHSPIQLTQISHSLTSELSRVHCFSFPFARHIFSLFFLFRIKIFESSSQCFSPVSCHIHVYGEQIFGHSVVDDVL